MTELRVSAQDEPPHRYRRIAVTGTYSTGKSTLTEALSLATGIPRTHARTSRELLAETNPDKTVMELDSIELIELGLRRFEERLRNEADRTDFISDGSVIHEWVYGAARAETGINPGAPFVLRAVKRAAGWQNQRAYRRYLDHFREIAVERAATLYDAVIHLPVEFPLVDDGHRPVSEPFRNRSDALLQKQIADLGLPVMIVTGSTENRVADVIAQYRLPQILSTEEAVMSASARVDRGHQILTEDARRRAEVRGQSLARTLRYAVRY